MTWSMCAPRFIAAGVAHEPEGMLPSGLLPQAADGVAIQTRKGRSGMNTLVVGVGDMKANGQPECCLVTYALGSCIAVAVYDPLTRVAGLLHFMLPESRLDDAKARRNPFLYADTGVPLLLEAVYRLGARKERLQVRLAGGASMMKQANHFEIGKRNYTAVRKILWREGLMVHGEDVGGHHSRTVWLDQDTGRFWWRDGDRVEREIGGRQKGAIPCR